MNKAIVINEMLRDDFRRTVSRLLMETSDENKKETNIWIYNDKEERDVAKVNYIYLMPGSGEIGVGVDYFGHSKEEDFDDLDTDWQDQIVRGLFPEYKPMVLVQKNTADGKREDIIVLSLDQLDGKAWFILDETMRDRLAPQLEEYRLAYPDADKSLKEVIDRLSKGQRSFFNGYEYFFEDADHRVPDIDDLVKLTDEQKELVKQMESLHQKMQTAGIAFVINDDQQVAVYNSQGIDDVAPANTLFEEIPDGYEYVNQSRLHVLFPVWESEDLYLKRK